ncbi:MarC family protein [Sphingomonas sp.]|uniref:MarC family protein n=1 Tax=Sphingomonas sp. TaxID=28214 RepID=UPI0025D2245B|nr:MarC family protein [Sphingomonas sp.]
MIALFISAFVTFFVVIDPPGCAPIFASLTAGAPAQHRRNMAIRSVMVASCILFAFALGGKPFLRSMGVSLEAFKVAGGIMLFLIALEMVFEKRTERRESRVQDVKSSPVEHDDISIFPMGIPMIAGPGSIASAMLLCSRVENWYDRGVVLAAMTAILIITLISLLLAGPLMKLLGTRLEAMITRVLGVILAALATQFVIDGIKASFRI